MRKYLSVILLLQILVISKAQQTTANAGDNIKGSSGSISYSIGQQDYITYSSITGIINEGLQQPFESFCSFLSGNIVAPSGIRQFAKLVPTVMIHNNVANLQQFSGHYTLQLSNNINVLLTAYKNNDINKANGVTTLDIALIQSHILQKSVLNSPYKILAADVNGDGKVSTLDIVYIKRLILGLDTTFTKTSINEKRLWAFVDSSYQFPDTINPFPFKDSISYTGLSVSKSNQTFIGCKLGDVTWDWNPAIAKPGINNNTPVELSYEPIKLQNEKLVRIPIKVKNFKEMLGLQYTISFNAAALKYVGVNNKALNFETGTNHAAEGKISLLWVDTKSEYKTLEDGSVLFELVLERTGKEVIGKEAIENTLSIDGSVTTVVAYDKDYQSHDVVMKNAPITIAESTTENWVVAPNPAKGGVIKVHMNLSDRKILVFRLSDEQGRLLLTKQVEGVKGSNHFILREGNIASGIYYLQVVGVDGVKQLRIEN